VEPRSSRGVMGLDGNPVETCTGSFSMLVIVRGVKPKRCPRRFRRVVFRPALPVPTVHLLSSIEIHGRLTFTLG